MATPTTTKSLTTDKPTGALINLATFAIDTSDKAAATAFGFASDVRGELRTAVDGGIDAVENLVRAMFRISKRLTARVDELAADVTATGERAVGGLLKGLRDTTRAANELAATAAGAVVGADRDGRTSAQA